MVDQHNFPLVLSAFEDARLRLEALDSLPHHGWRVLTVGTSAEVAGMLLQHQPDALLIDATMAETAALFASLKMPCVAVVAPGETELMVRLLRDHAVSACLPLPMQVEVTAAALNALLRLTGPVTESIDNFGRPREDEVTGTWTLSSTTWTLAAPGSAPTQLNQAETTFLSTLAAQPGSPVSRKAMISALGHNEEYFDSRRLDTLLSRLRIKVTKETGQHLPVRCIHAVGYAFAAPIAVES